MIYIPERIIHNKWAEKFGISNFVSDFVNQLIDFPIKQEEFQRFCREHGMNNTAKLSNTLFMRYDSEKVGKSTYAQLRFLKHRDSGYLKAWHLHHILDYIKYAPKLIPKEVLKRYRKKVENGPELDIIEKFVKENLKEIISDLRR